MSIITAYKCDETGVLFEDKIDYQKHLRRIAADRLRRRKAKEERKAEADWWFNNFWNKVRSFAELKAAILYHKDKFATNGVNNYSSGRRMLKPTPIVEFIEFSLKYESKVSNTHSCPHNGVMNWGGRVKLSDGSPAPRGYPGWCGRLSYDVQSHKGQTGAYPGGSDIFTDTRIHTGSGGGGGHKYERTKFLQNFGYEIKLYAADWPAMAEAYEFARMTSILKDSKQNIDEFVNSLYPGSGYKP